MGWESAGPYLTLWVEVDGGGGGLKILGVGTFRSVVSKKEMWPL